MNPTKNVAICITVFLLVVGGFIYNAGGMDVYNVENFESTSETVSTNEYSVFLEEAKTEVPESVSVFQYNRTDRSDLGEILRSTEYIDRQDRDHIPTDYVPEYVQNVIDDHDYIRYEGSYYKLSYEEPVPDETGLKIDAQLIDPEATALDPAVVQVKMEVTADKNVSFASGAPHPFGVLTVEGDNGRFVLWNEEYEKNSHVSAKRMKSVGIVDSIAVGGKHSSGKIVAKNYSIYPYARGVQADSYALSDNIDYRVNRSDRRTVNYKIGFDLE